MKKRWTFALSFLLIWIVAGCSKEEPATAEDRLQEYVALWEKSDFINMHNNYLTEETTAAFNSEYFIDRQEKLYTDLEIENVKITYEAPPEEKEFVIEEPATFIIHISMNTAAGPLKFDKELRMIHEIREEQENWFAEWDPSFILPGLGTKDTVGISTISSKRGEIVDRNGLPIAVNGAGYEIGIVPERFTDSSSKKTVSDLLGVSTEYIDKQLNQSWVKPNYFVPLKVLSNTKKELVERLIELPGVTYQKSEMREYPFGEALAHVSGYVGKITTEQLEKLADEGYTETDLIGRQGMERVLEDRLRGHDGIRIYIKEPVTGATPITIVEKPAQDGEVISLTIDAKLQKSLFDSMKGRAGTSAAVDPQTGETLALVSSPSFDPTEFMLGVSSARYNEMAENPLKPLFNRYAASYAPGSSLKPITAAIGMEIGNLNPEEGLSITGRTWQKDASWGNYRVSRLHPEAPNPINLNNALIYSDNIYFAQQALAMGRQTFIDGLTRYGFGEDIPFVLNIASSQISNDGKISSEGQLADTSFGQGQMLTNILHLATMYEAFVNGGTMYKPTLLLDEQHGEVWKDGLLSKDNAAVIRSNLRDVVVKGFAQSANLPNIALAGKTGTAELKAAGTDRGHENGFFVAYDSENPTQIIAMMIEGIENDGGSDFVAAMVADALTMYRGQ
ncbi:penicillin-binding transpeptidase domain-containing protein [Sporosarcina sp. Sa2YVA2]|uniref:Penicillin-binding transpeptidase domain-containing protein n=1 Tax=Sporosarcina quadrami TaxID=2762234 RepID=A0ABR8UAI4_9BACL|nr:penicillin-binding transpeptidase domain-containing protein [Sporosarcina quadrami]MBD7985011.1 penicillin-binding transpeptidase domain-containing protein [Sporosarcina quadrami]